MMSLISSLTLFCLKVKTKEFFGLKRILIPFKSVRFALMKGLKLFGKYKNLTLDSGKPKKYKYIYFELFVKSKPDIMKSVDKTFSNHFANFWNTLTNYFIDEESFNLVLKPSSRGQFVFLFCWIVSTTLCLKGLEWHLLTGRYFYHSATSTHPKMYLLTK